MYYLVIVNHKGKAVHLSSSDSEVFQEVLYIQLLLLLKVVTACRSFSSELLSFWEYWIVENIWNCSCK